MSDELKRARDRRHNAYRRAHKPWISLYNSARWKALRLSQLSKQPLCERCRSRGKVTAATVAHHISRHEGNEVLFFDPGNLASSCKPCHDGIEQQIERRGYSTEVGVDGWPVDPNHPSNASPSRGGSMSYPSWFRASYVPLTIVCGPPASGKSTYVRKQAGPNDLVICMDQIRLRMKGLPMTGPRQHLALTANEVADALRIRNEMIGDLFRPSARARWQRAFLIVGEPNAERRQWWADTLKPETIVVLATPADECRRRAQADAEKEDPRPADAIVSIATWWQQYQPRVGDTVQLPSASQAGRQDEPSSRAYVIA